MKYILTEKQIEKLVYDVGIQPGSYGIILDDFLKSKTPVEEIAEGEVKDNSLLPGVVSYKIGDIDDLKIFYNIYNRQNKNIKIYIEEITSKNSRVSFKDIKLSIENSPNRKEVIK